MQKLLIATHNPAKLQELQSFLSDVPLEILSLSDVGITQDIIENGKTYKENAEKKALFYAKLSGFPTLSDDGGIEIESLGYKPGIHSKRWLGFEASDDVLIAHMQKTADKLGANRAAYFRVVLSFALPDGKVFSVDGEIKGEIAKKPLQRKKAGFPFRSFFYLPDIQKYYFETELTAAELKTHNHRYKATEKIKPIIIKYLKI